MKKTRKGRTRLLCALLCAALLLFSGCTRSYYGGIAEREDGDADMRKTVCEQVVDLAEMARQPLTAERMVAFLKRSTKILGLAVKE